MEIVNFLAGASVLMGMVLVGSVVAIRFAVWPVYVVVRDERDDLQDRLEIVQERLDAVTKDRDGWRDAAQRSLLLAQIGRQVTRRAVRAVTTSATTP